MGGGRSPPPLRRPLYLDRVDRLLQQSVNQLKLGHGYSAHAMRATVITMAPDNGAKLEDVKWTVGHADSSMTQLYDRRRFMPAKSAALVVNYGKMSEDGV